MFPAFPTSSVYHELHLQFKLHSIVPATAERYLLCIRRFADKVGMLFAQVQHTHVRRYLVDLLEKEHFGSANYNMHLAALKFLFNKALLRPDVVAPFPFLKVQAPVRNILSPAEVRSLLDAISHPVHRTILTTAYAAGLRISEACALSIHEIDSKRGLINLASGKGGKPRQIMLSEKLLLLLRDHWRSHHSGRSPKTHLLFPADVPLRDRPIPAENVRVSLRLAVQSLGWSFKVTPHLLRHSFASTLHQQGVDPLMLQALLGHSSLSTTMRYVHPTPSQIAAIQSPLDLLDAEEGTVRS